MILKEISNSKTDKNIFSISWDLSSVCNYKCSYCQPKFNDGKNKFPRFEEALPFLKDILKTYPNRQIGLEIKGGEPTLWKDLPKLLEFCEKHQWQTLMISNGSRPLSWWENMAPLFDRVILSFHPEKSSIEHFDNLIQILQDKCFLRTSIMMYPPYFERAQKAWSHLSKKYPEVYIEAAIVNEIVHKYSNKQLAFIENALLRKTLEPSGQESFSEVPQWKTSTQNFRNIALIKTDTQDNLSLSAEEIKLKKLNFFQGWKCSAGLDRIQINMDGSIYRALCQAGGPIGHISKDWKFPSEPVTCNTKQCFCSPEIVLEKHSP